METRSNVMLSTGAWRDGTVMMMIFIMYEMYFYLSREAIKNISATVIVLPTMKNRMKKMTIFQI